MRPRILARNRIFLHIVIQDYRLIAAVCSMYREKVDLIDSNLFSRKKKPSGRTIHLFQPTLEGDEFSRWRGKFAWKIYPRIGDCFHVGHVSETPFRQYICRNLIRLVLSIFIMMVWCMPSIKHWVHRKRINYLMLLLQWRAIQILFKCYTSSQKNLLRKIR